MYPTRVAYTFPVRGTMRRCYLACAILFLSCPLLAGDPPNRIVEGGIKGEALNASSLTVLSWNIERGQKLPDVIDVIWRQGACLILLQEVDVNARRTGRLNIAEELAGNLRMPYYFATEFEELGQGSRKSPAYQGQATLTWLAASSTRIIRFEHQSGFWGPRPHIPNWSVFQRRKGGRLALVAELEVGGRLLVVYNVHLESREGEDLRKAQMEEILNDSLRYPPDTPLLIAGDFNTRVTSSPVLSLLAQAGFRMAAGNQVTTKRGLPLDWIFIRGPIESENAAVHKDVKASDHLPLTVDIRLETDSSAPAGHPYH